MQTVKLDQIQLQACLTMFDSGSIALKRYEICLYWKMCY